MSESTQRFVQAELERLVAQRDRYLTASNVAVTPRQRRHRTTRLRALDEEILGHREALIGLGGDVEPEAEIPIELEFEADLMALLVPGTSASPRRAPTTPPLAAPLPAVPQRPGARAFAKVSGSAFTLGFGMTAALLWITGLRPAMEPQIVQRAVTPIEAPARAHVEADPVLAAGSDRAWTR
jgi:hypothetical protein